MISEQDVKRKYAKIGDELYDIFCQKIEQYGTKMYSAHTVHFKYWAAYFNVRRKTLRLEKLTNLSINGDAPARAKLLSDYKDLANYAIMAIQILEDDHD